MQIGEALYSKLSTTTTLTALVSTKIYPMSAPQSAALPFVTYEESYGEWPHAMSRDPGITMKRMELTSWSTGYAQVHSIALQVRKALQDYSGTMGGTGGVPVQRIFMEQEVDVQDVDPTDQRVLYAVTQSFLIWHTS